MSQSEFSWMHQNNYCSSLAARAFWKRNRLKQCFKHTFNHFNFSRSHLTNIHEKNRDQGNKSRWSKSPDNRGSTVLLKSMHSVIVLVSRMQKSGTGNTNFCQLERDILIQPTEMTRTVKVFEVNIPVKPTKLKRFIPFDFIKKIPEF